MFGGKLNMTGTAAAWAPTVVKSVRNLMKLNFINSQWKLTDGFTYLYLQCDSECVCSLTPNFVRTEFKVTHFDSEDIFVQLPPTQQRLLPKVNIRSQKHKGHAGRQQIFSFRLREPKFKGMMYKYSLILSILDDDRQTAGSQATEIIK